MPPLARGCSAAAVWLGVATALSPALAAQEARELLVCSAASAAPVVSEAAERFSREHERAVLVSSGASGTLLSQILAGAPCDLLVTADARHAHALFEKGRTRQSAAIPLATNSLVLAIWKDAATNAREASTFRSPQTSGETIKNRLRRVASERLAIADPALAPLGRYSAEALLSAGIDIATHPPIASLGSAAAVVKALQTRSVDAAILYASDSARLPADIFLFSISPAMHSPIRYVAIPIITDRGNDEPAAAFAEFLRNDQSAWKRAALTPISSEPARRADASGGTSEIAELRERTGSQDAPPAPPAIGNALLRTLQTSLIATLLNLVPGTLIGLWLARSRGPIRVLVESLTIAPLVVPPVVTGFALLVALRAIAPDLLFTLPAAALAAMIVSLPLIIRSVRAAAEQTDARLPVVAATLGASRARVLFTVTLPLILPGIVGGATLAWARAAGEFGATIVVAGNVTGRTQTLPLAIWTAIQSPADVPLLPMVLASIALSVAAVAIGEWFIRSRRAEPAARTETPPA